MEHELPEAENNFFDEAWDEANDAKSQEEKQEENNGQPQSQEEDKASVRPEDESHLANADESKASTETDDTDYKALYEKEVQKTKSWAGRIRKANADAQAAQEEVARLRQENQELRKKAEGRQQDSPQGDQVDTDDETLQSFLKEFPDLHAPLQALIRKEAKALIGNGNEDLKTEVESLKQRDAARQKEQQESAAKQHFSSIEKAHPDFRTLVQEGKLDDWIATKPSYMQDGLDRIAKEGSASEVIEMFNLMKQDLGMKPSPKPTNETSGDKQEKLKSMVAVPGSSGGPPPDGPDKDDFDGAWDEAVKK